MDSLRGLGENDRDYADEHDDDAVMDENGAFGSDERRMHVRAYNHWALLLGDRSFPSIEDLDPDSLDDFGPHSVLLDFTAGVENPAIPFIGEKLRRECGFDEDIGYISDVPPRSLLSRVTDHYMQIIANEAPIGFEAEFENARGESILYRGILLPFSSDDDSIDFIYAVINWKTAADDKTAGELKLAIDQALAAAPRRAAPSTAWDDGPAAEAAEAVVEPAASLAPNGLDSAAHDLPVDWHGEDDVLDLAGAGFEIVAEGDDAAFDMPVPGFGAVGFEEPETAEIETVEPEIVEATRDAQLPAVLGDDEHHPEEIAQPSPEDTLEDWLRHARAFADYARIVEDRSRHALYDAVSRAYDFSLVAERHPEEYRALLEASGISVQDRAPMTPIVKLVFGARYDKTRLTEYATVLGHAHRIGVGFGGLGDYLAAGSGGIKALVREERDLRRDDSEPREDRFAAVEARLRRRAPVPLDTIACGEDEIVVLVARRDERGALGIVGKVEGDEALVRKVLTRAAS